MEDNLPYLPPPDIIPNIDFFRKSLNSSIRDNWMLLMISGPVRSGNHLLHSMMDSHSDLPRVPGEDPTMLEFFSVLLRNSARIVNSFSFGDIADILLGEGDEDRGWNLTMVSNQRYKKQYEISLKETNQLSPQGWAGQCSSESGIIYDYQDSAISVDYPRFKMQLLGHRAKMQCTNRLCDLFYYYLDALQYLDNNYSPESGQLFFCSGMTHELNFLLDVNYNARAIISLRQFDGFCSSFIKARYHSDYSKKYAKEAIIAWGHWSSKVSYYLNLKCKFPDRVCLVNFDSVICDNIATGKKICDFIGIPYNSALEVATVFGHKVKGNSSFRVDEHNRGKFYRGKRHVVLDQKIAILSQKLWDNITPLLL